MEQLFPTGIEDVFIRPFLSNYHIILGSALFFLAVQKISFILSVLYYPGFYLYRKEDQDEWAVRVAAAAHCILSFITLPDFFRVFVMNQETITSTVSYVGYIVGLSNNQTLASLPEVWLQQQNPYQPLAMSEIGFAITTGYFVWDLFITVIYGWGIGYLIHAIVSVSVFFFSLYPYLHTDGLLFHGAFEVSTLFLHIRMMLEIAGRKKGKAYAITSGLFGITFIFFRIILGTLVSVRIWAKTIFLIENGGSHSNYISAYFLLGDFIIMSLQFIWLVPIVKAILGIEDAPQPAQVDQKKKKT